MRTSEYYEKEGMFLEAYCQNPLTGHRMPIYATNFVVADYGTGCVMAVPTHDQRDFEFAKKFNLPMIVVIQPADKPLNVQTMTEAYVGEGILNSLRASSTAWKILKAIDPSPNIWKLSDAGRRTIQYRLRDWGNFAAALLGGTNSHGYLRKMRPCSRS